MHNQNGIYRFKKNKHTGILWYLYKTRKKLAFMEWNGNVNASNDVNKSTL